MFMGIIGDLNHYYMIEPQDGFIRYVLKQTGREFAVATWSSLIQNTQHIYASVYRLEFLRAYPGSFDADHKNSIDYMFDWLTAHLNQVDTGWIDCIFLEQLRPFFQNLCPENLRERNHAYRDHYLSVIAKDKES